MARTTTSRDRYDTSPRPVAQSLWLLSTVIIAAIMLSFMGDTLATFNSSAGNGAFTGQDLQQLADPVGADNFDASTDLDPGGPTIAVQVGQPTKLEAGELSSGELTRNPDSDLAGAGESAGDLGPDASIEVRGQAALDRISYPWLALLPEWSIVFLPGRQGLYGLTLVPEKQIEIYIRDGQSTTFLAHVIAHEMGHAVDVTLNSGSDRRRWEDARGIDSHPWWPESGATDFSTGAGDFAESFAAWQVGIDSFRSKLADAPTEAEIELLAELSAG